MRGAASAGVGALLMLSMLAGLQFAQHASGAGNGVISACYTAPQPNNGRGDDRGRDDRSRDNNDDNTGGGCGS
jgi:hypothetical protein